MSDHRRSAVGVVDIPGLAFATAPASTILAAPALKACEARSRSMPERRFHCPLSATWPDLMARHLDRRDREMMEALVTAGALVARADGSVDGSERDHLLGFIRQRGLLVRIAPGEILDAFDGRLRQLEQSSGPRSAMASLRPLAGWSRAVLVVEAAAFVAAADGEIHPDELRALRHIRAALTARAWPVRRPEA
jgi:tellurite resistance protein